MTSVDTNYTFTGREDDGNGLMYYRNRYYSPSMKRFISEDPVGLQGGLNQYAYLEGNHLSYADPFGLRDVYLYTWSGFPGHSMVTKLNGTTILGIWPAPKSDGSPFSPFYAKNVELNFLDSFQAEGHHSPNHMFIIHVPDDISFDKAVKLEKSKGYFFLSDLFLFNNTNCTASIYVAFKAGGVNLDNSLLSNAMPVRTPSVLSSQLSITENNGNPQIEKIY